MTEFAKKMCAKNQCQPKFPFTRTSDIKNEDIHWVYKEKIFWKSILHKKIPLEHRILKMKKINEVCRERDIHEKNKTIYRVCKEKISWKSMPNKICIRNNKESC